jgi:hypothetical protein
MNEYDEHFITTYTGKKFHYLDPQAEEIDIVDIAHALSMTCRFGGHVHIYYSVAEHSVRVSEQVANEEHTKLAALLHDASEAYIPDIPRPIKMDMPQSVRDINLMIEEAIFAKYVPEFDANWGAIKHQDEVLLATEARDLMDNMDDWLPLPKPLYERIIPYPSPGYAERYFLKMFDLYGGTR